MNDRTLNFSMEDIISNMDIPNKDKERLYLEVLRQKGTKDCTVIWRNNRIVGFRPNQSMEKISLIIKIDNDGVEIENDKETN